MWVSAWKWTVNVRVVVVDEHTAHSKALLDPAVVAEAAAAGGRRIVPIDENGATRGCGVKAVGASGMLSECGRGDDQRRRDGHHSNLWFVDHDPCLQSLRALRY